MPSARIARPAPSTKTASSLCARTMPGSERLATSRTPVEDTGTWARIGCMAGAQCSRCVGGKRQMVWRAAVARRQAWQKPQRDGRLGLSSLARPCCASALLNRATSASRGSQVVVRRAAAADSERSSGIVLTWYYFGDIHGGIGHEQGTSHHPEANPGCLGYNAGKQGRVRCRERRSATQARQETCLFTR